MTQRELLAHYIVNRRNQLENDVQMIEQNFRFRRTDVNDGIEYAFAKYRLEFFDEVAKDISVICRFVKGKR